MSEDLSGFSMMELFRMEAESHTGTLSAGLVALEGVPATPEFIEPLMRAAHSLKGAARIVGVDAAVRVAHAMEDAFVAVQRGKVVLRPEHIDILLNGVDLLAQIAQLDEREIETWQRERCVEVDQLVADLTGLLEGTVPAQPTSSASDDSRPVLTSSPAVSCTSDGAVTHSDSTVVAEAMVLIPADSVQSVPVPHRSEENEVREQPDTAGLALHRDKDRVVRVNAQSLTSLMGLAGEALVQAHRLPPLVESLWRFAAGRRAS